MSKSITIVVYGAKHACGMPSASGSRQTSTKRSPARNIRPNNPSMPYNGKKNRVGGNDDGRKISDGAVRYFR